MKKLRIGIICPSEIALRRFMPALQQIDSVEYVGLGHCSAEERFGKGNPVDNAVLQQDLDKAQVFVDQYGGKIFDSYYDIVTSKEIDAIYLPLPPALHYKWAKLALEQGKHVLVEKPATLSYENTAELVQLAKANNLALHENYMFAFHSQIEQIQAMVDNGEIGQVRLYRCAFGFPMRASGDFRYNKSLGGGALYDCGGYPIKLAGMLLGDSAKLVDSKLCYVDGMEVDIFGNAVMRNDKGVTAHISFGMDNSYKCELEVWGSTGSIVANRIFTAPAGFEPTITITTAQGSTTKTLPADDTFKKSILHFVQCISNVDTRQNTYNQLLLQASLVDKVRQGDK